MRTKLVAELSCNHLGRLDRMMALVREAKFAGVDAVKLQIWTDHNMVRDRNYVVQSGPWKGQNLAELYRQAETPWDWWQPLQALAAEIRIELFASVFDLPALAMLESNRCPAYKIASFEILDLELIRAAAATGKPIILSTGMASYPEIHRAVTVATLAGCCDLTLLKCTSGYPAPIDEMNLATMEHLRKSFRCKVGLSDHSMSADVHGTAMALGADMIEVHFTLKRADGGPDAAFSLEPAELRDLVQMRDDIQSILGEPHYGPTPSEMPQIGLRRSLYAAKLISAGQPIEPEHLTTARPALGAAPHYRDQVLRSRAKHDIKAGEPVRLEDLE